MRIGGTIRWTLCGTLILAAASGCAGNGDGLDPNGQPPSSSSSGSSGTDASTSSSSSSSASSSSAGALTADFASIQDDVFTPICTRCHIGASAPEGLQLDAAHSYALLVGVASTEEPDVLRVDPGHPDQSYIILKLEGAAGIIGGQMPLGGPYLPQSTIDTIAQWITNGAPPPSASQSMEQAERPAFEVVATSPNDRDEVRGPVRQIVVAFSSEVDASLVNWTTVALEKVTGDEFLTPSGAPLEISATLAAGDPSTLIIQPRAPLGPGMYRVRLRGTGGGALASVSAVTLGADDEFVFSVEAGQ